MEYPLPRKFSISGDFVITKAPDGAISGFWIRADEYQDHLTVVNANHQEQIVALTNELIALRVAGDKLASATAKFVCSKHYKGELTAWSEARGFNSDLRNNK
jgi:hypothetical protein